MAGFIPWEVQGLAGVEAGPDTAAVAILVALNSHDLLTSMKWFHYFNNQSSAYGMEIRSPVA